MKYLSILILFLIGCVEPIDYSSLRESSNHLAASCAEQGFSAGALYILTQINSGDHPLREEDFRKASREFHDKIINMLEGANL